MEKNNDRNGLEQISSLEAKVCWSGARRSKGVTDCPVRNVVVKGLGGVLRRMRVVSR